MTRALTKPRVQVERAEQLTLTALRERGWSTSMITDLLGEPDALKRNPYYRSAAPMPLYDAARVAAAETSEEFQAALAASGARSAGTQRAAKTKREALLKQVADMEVAVRVIELGTLRPRAVVAYEAWRETVVEKDAPQAFLDRITVNYIRHKLTAYDHALEAVAGRTGVTVGACNHRRSCSQTEPIPARIICQRRAPRAHIVRHWKHQDLGGAVPSPSSAESCCSRRFVPSPPRS